MDPSNTQIHHKLSLQFGKGINRRRYENVDLVMRNIEILNQHPKKVLEKLKLGKVDSIEYGVEQITDDFLIYGLRGGLIDELSKSFPDPRKECGYTPTPEKDSNLPKRCCDS